jgi:hypothetical protein
MSKNTNPIDALIAELAPVRDSQLVGEAQTSGAALLQTIVAYPVDVRNRGRTAGGRPRVLVLVGALALAAVLSLPAVGVVRQIAGLVSGADEKTPVPTAPAIVVASGKAGIPWKIVAVTSDHGLCLGVYARDSVEGWVGNATCDYLDLRGDLPSDMRGNPSRPCLASPTMVVPCGTLPRHWVDFPAGTQNDSGYSELDRVVLFGPAAQAVASVDLILTNGEKVRAHLVERPEGLGAPLNFYWVALPLAWRYEESHELVEEPEMVIARDSSGHVLERRVAAWNGNPSGDPAGEPPPVSLRD